MILKCPRIDVFKSMHETNRKNKYYRKFYKTT